MTNGARCRASAPPQGACGKSVAPPLRLIGSDLRSLSHIMDMGAATPGAYAEDSLLALDVRAARASPASGAHRLAPAPQTLQEGHVVSGQTQLLGFTHCKVPGQARSSTCRGFGQGNWEIDTSRGAGGRVCPVHCSLQGRFRRTWGLSGIRVGEAAVSGPPGVAGRGYRRGLSRRATATHKIDVTAGLATLMQQRYEERLRYVRNWCQRVKLPTLDQIGDAPSECANLCLKASYGFASGADLAGQRADGGFPKEVPKTSWLPQRSVGRHDSLAKHRWTSVPLEFALLRAMVVLACSWNWPRTAVALVCGLRAKMRLGELFSIEP
jgi:hypothetical protein